MGMPEQFAGKGQRWEKSTKGITQKKADEVIGYLVRLHSSMNYLPPTMFQLRFSTLLGLKKNVPVTV